MTRTTLAAAALAASVGAAPAAATDATRAAMDLGALLAAEEFCGLAFDHDAIEAYIDWLEVADAMGFASALATNTRLASRSQGGLSDSGRIAHCRAIENTARHQGLIN